jgi:hypothetical protein
MALVNALARDSLVRPASGGCEQAEPDVEFTARDRTTLTPSESDPARR